MHRSVPGGAGGDVLCGHVGGGGNGDKLPEDIFGHVNVVVGDEQGFLDVLIGVALAHEALDLTGELRGGSSHGSGRAPLQAAARFPLGVDPPWQGLRRPLWHLGAL